MTSSNAGKAGDFHSTSRVPFVFNAWAYLDRDVCVPVSLVSLIEMCATSFLYFLSFCMS